MKASKYITINSQITTTYSLHIIIGVSSYICTNFRFYLDVERFSSLDALEKAIISHASGSLYVILFHSSPDGEHKELNYTIRSKNQLLGIDQIYRNNYDDWMCWSEKDHYMTNGLLALQIAINEEFMRLQNITMAPVSVAKRPCSIICYGCYYNYYSISGEIQTLPSQPVHCDRKFGYPNLLHNNDRDHVPDRHRHRTGPDGR